MAPDALTVRDHLSTSFFTNTPKFSGEFQEAALAEVKAEIAAEKPQIGELDAILLELPAVQAAEAAAP